MSWNLRRFFARLGTAAVCASMLTFSLPQGSAERPSRSIRPMG